MDEHVAPVSGEQTGRLIAAHVVVGIDTGNNTPLTARSPKLSGDCNLEVFVDTNLVEIFINSGAYVISHVVYGIDPFFES